jgi:hypothetical protein
MILHVVNTSIQNTEHAPYWEEKTPRHPRSELITPTSAGILRHRSRTPSAWQAARCSSRATGRQGSDVWPQYLSVQQLTATKTSKHKHMD